MFSYDANAANNKLHFGSSLTGTEQSFKGDLYSWGHVGLIQAESHKAELFRLVLNSFSFKPVALYITDENYPQYGNFFQADRRPFMYAGESSAAEAADPQIDPLNGGLSIKGGTYFKTRELKIGNTNTDPTADFVDVFSFFVRILFYSLPSAGDEIVVKLKGTKVINLCVDSSGSLLLKSEATILHTYAADQVVADGNWNYISVTIGRVQLNPSNFDSFYMIEVQNLLGDAEGGSFTCKLFFF
jgi:hypothetical protein